jgi:hypothetical protein
MCSSTVSSAPLLGPSPRVRPHTHSTPPLISYPTPIIEETHVDIYQDMPQAPPFTWSGEGCSLVSRRGNETLPTSNVMCVYFPSHPQGSFKGPSWCVVCGVGADLCVFLVWVVVCRLCIGSCGGAADVDHVHLRAAVAALPLRHGPQPTGTPLQHIQRYIITHNHTHRCRARGGRGLTPIGVRGDMFTIRTGCGHVCYRWWVDATDALCVWCVWCVGVGG